MYTQEYDVATIDKLYADNARLRTGLKNIIQYEEDTEWESMTGKAPSEVTTCAIIARYALNEST